MKLGYNYESQSLYSDQCQSRGTNIFTQPRQAWVLVLSIFCFSNLLVLTASVVNFRKLFLWFQGQNDQMKTLYKASATVLTCVNIIVLISDLYIVVSDGIAQGIGYAAIATILLPAKVPLVVLILILETSVICSNTHSLNGPNQMDTRCQRFAHALAFCQIIWFVRRLINDAIISILFFALAPAQTIGIVTLLLSIIASAIAFTSILIHDYIYKDCSKKTRAASMSCVLLNGIMFCGLLFAITLLYIVLVDNGLQSAGMGGIVLSLILPLIVSTTFYIIKKRYFKSISSGSVNELQEMNETSTDQSIDTIDRQPQETTPLLQVRS